MTPRRSSIAISLVWMVTGCEMTHPDDLAPQERSALTQDAGGSVLFDLPDDEPQALSLALESPVPARPRRVIFIAIDSLNPLYIEMDRLAAGPGSPGNWLMPWVRAFAKGSTHWPMALAHYPQATDMNHLNILASTHSGATGVVGVWRQPETWGADGLQLGNIHLSKARYPDGKPVETLFNLIEKDPTRQAKTAFIGNKGWVPEEYGDAVDIIVNGHQHPGYIPPPYYLSFHDNPFTDPDRECDPETKSQTLLLDLMQRRNPAEHPRDFWVADAALKVMKREDPDMIYVLLGDLDHAQHYLGAVNDPDEWFAGPVPELPSECEAKPHYRLRSHRNPLLLKEPILDLIRDVDRAFGRLMIGLAKGGFLEDAAIVLVSDHNMVNYLFRKDLDPYTDVTKKLADAGLLPEEKDFYIYGAGSLGLLYWRPEYRAANPDAVGFARDELRDFEKHAAVNPQTKLLELPWGIMDHEDMQYGRADLGILPGEFFHPFFVKHGVWPDLAVVMKNGWQIPSGAFNTGGTMPWRMNAGHGAPDTAAVMTAIRGLGYTPRTTCGERVWLSDVAATVADRLGWLLPQPVGTPMTCSASGAP